MGHSWVPKGRPEDDHPNSRPDPERSSEYKKEWAEKKVESDKYINGEKSAKAKYPETNDPWGEPSSAPKDDKPSDSK